MVIKSDDSRGISSHSIREMLKIRAFEVRESPEDLGYSYVKDWPKLPAGWKLGPVASVAADSAGRYYLFHRGKESPPLQCYNREGELITSWGEGLFNRPHGVQCDENNNVWLVDDRAHVLYLYSPDGTLLKTFGTKGVPGRDGSHFFKPTDIAWSQENFFVSDGYGNKRVAKFDRDLNYMGEWGHEGLDKGEFLLPHGICVGGDGLVYVADRVNWRVQIFSPGGKYVKEWTHIGKPETMVYASDGFYYTCLAVHNRVVKLDSDGSVVGWFEDAEHCQAHNLAVANNGDILVAQLTGPASLFIRK